VIVLGVESSCDETAAALVRETGEVLADVVSSQVKLHAPYGGVVPELAARAHVQNIVPVLEGAFAQAGLSLDDVDAIAVTNGPGLVGALLVGVQAGKAIALARNLPLVGVNHLVGHLLSGQITRKAATGSAASSSASTHAQTEYPFIALLVSGGHTALYEVRSPTDMAQLGQTRDDAAGEAFDKVAKLLGLGYPGGPRVDRLAAQGDASKLTLPRPLRRQGSLEFSFSGLKTAVAQLVHKHGPYETEQEIADLCAAFQGVVVESLVEKSLEACRVRSIPRLVITGGVAANKGLRAYAKLRSDAAGVALTVPPVQSCTDNAAMIAYAGVCKLQAGMRDGIDLDVFSRSPILGATASTKRYRSQRLPRP
jgi:N6-L-threonylcarbamoyladenine synthase